MKYMVLLFSIILTSTYALANDKCDNLKIVIDKFSENVLTEIYIDTKGLSGACTYKRVLCEQDAEVGFPSRKMESYSYRLDQLENLYKLYERKCLKNN